MRKFKHRATGYIATESNSQKNYTVSEPRNFTIPKWIVENGEDWKELIEKEYEIISVKTLAADIILTYKGENCIERSDKQNLTNSLSLSQALELGLKINSVKRTLDNQVFTTGDVFVYNGLNNNHNSIINGKTYLTLYKIKKFEISNNGLYILSNVFLTDGSISEKPWRICAIKNVEKVLIPD